MEMIEALIGAIVVAIGIITLAGGGAMGDPGRELFNWMMFKPEPLPPPRPVSFLDPHDSEDERPPTWEELFDEVERLDKEVARLSDVVIRGEAQAKRAVEGEVALISRYAKELNAKDQSLATRAMMIKDKDAMIQQLHAQLRESQEANSQLQRQLARFKPHKPSEPLDIARATLGSSSPRVDAVGAPRAKPLSGLSSRDQIADRVNSLEEIWERNQRALLDEMRRG